LFTALKSQHAGSYLYRLAQTRERQTGHRSACATSALSLVHFGKADKLHVSGNNRAGFTVAFVPGQGEFFQFKCTFQILI